MLPLRPKKRNGRGCGGSASISNELCMNILRTRGSSLWRARTVQAFSFHLGSLFAKIDLQVSELVHRALEPVLTYT